MGISIDHLFGHPEHLGLVARWIYNEFWAGKAGYSVETFEDLLRQANEPDHIPLSLVAYVDGQPAGTVNLIQCDSQRRPNLFPWLAALVVVPVHRRKGVGSLLVRRLVSEAERLGIEELFLGTDIPSYYAAFGANIHERFEDNLCIMRIPLRAP